MKLNIRLLSMALCACALGSCTDDNVEGETGGNQTAIGNRMYAVMSSSGDNTGVYIQTVSNVTKDSLLDATTNTSNRIFSEGTNSDFVNFNGKYLINLCYPSKGGSTSDYITRAYEVEDGKMVEHGTGLAFDGDFKARGFFKDYLIGVSATTTADGRYAERVKFVDVDDFGKAVVDGILLRDDAKSGPTTELEGEIWDVNEIAEYGDYVLVGYSPQTTTLINPDNPKGGYVTKLSNNFYLGVYKFDPNDADKEYLKYQSTIVRKSADHPGKEAGQIRSNMRARTENSIKVVDGKIYIFAQGTAKNSDVAYPETPSALLRISGNNIQDGKPVGIDDDFYVNLTELTGGYYLWRTYYLGDNKFCFQLFSVAGAEGTVSSKTDAQAATHKRFGIYDLANNTFKMVSGMPEPENISDIALAYALDQDNHTISFEVQLTDGSKPTIYTINSDGTVVKGLQVKTESMGGISFLKEYDD